MFGRKSRLARRSVPQLLGLLLIALPALVAPAPSASAKPEQPQQPQAPISGCGLPFSDVAADNPFYAPINKLVCGEIVAGYDDGTFRPGANVTRGQLAKFVSNAAGYDDEIPANQQSFSDVPTDNPFWLFIERVHMHDVVGGYADGSFKPFNTVTRGQTAKFVSNAAGYNDEIGASQQSFGDVPSNNPFWLFVERVHLRGVVGGYADGSFKPANSVTRGQTAKFIANSLLAPSAQQLIAAARAAGSIDYGTALLYRAYALFGDPRLPVQYLGSGSDAEDQSLVTEINAPDEPIPAALQAQLQPYGLRPDEDGSIFSVDAPSAKAAAPANGSKESANAITCASNGWASQLATHQARVWSRCNRPQDADYEAHINAAVSVIDTIWDPMSNYMGQPILDAGGRNGGGDTNIDIYLLDIGQSDPRGTHVEPPANGYSPPAAPFNGHKSSSYMVISNTRLTEPQLHSTMIHEFFHVLQAAHNYQLYDRPNDGVNHFWFSEASATWASSFFDRTLNWPARGAASEVFTRFLNFQHTVDTYPLHLNAPTDHIYSDFIYPYFMVQETTPDVIATAWREFEGLGRGDWDGALQKLDNLFSFADHFPDFTLRNLNHTFDGQNPLGVRYIDQDDTFPDNAWPHFADKRRLSVIPVSEPPLKIYTQVLALSGTYYHFSIGTGVRQVKLDFSHVEANGSLASNPLRIRAVVKKSDGTWEVRALSNHGETTLCDIADLYLVLTNIDFDTNTAMLGHFDVRPLQVPCSCDSSFEVQSGWNGSLGVNWQANGTGTRPGGGVLRGSVSRHADVSLAWRIKQETPEFHLLTWLAQQTDGSLSGSGHIDDTQTYTFNGNTSTQWVRGSGALYLLSAASLILHSDDCSYDIQGYIYLPTESSDNSTTLMGLAMFQAAHQQLPDSQDVGPTLYGAKTIPVTLTAAPGTRDTYFGGGADQASSAVLDTTNNLGRATVNWEFNPAPQP